MCGIFAAKMQTPDNGVFDYAMRFLQYRGYDSWGFSYDGLNIKSIEKYKGEILEIAGRINLGILHTRWATTGEVSLENAHPIQVHGYSMVMNGIVTNHKAVADQTEGLKTNSDTEVLLRMYIDGNVHLAQGNFAFVVKHPNGKVFAYRRGIPLYACWQLNGNMFFTSDIGAVEGDFSYYMIKEDTLNDMDAIRKTAYGIDSIWKSTQQNRPTAYMTTSGSLTLDELRESRSIITKLGERKYPFMSHFKNRYVGSGSSYNAALFAKYLSANGSEAYIPQDVVPQDLMVYISQSGESFDIIEASKRQIKQLNVCLTNNINSSLANNCKTVIDLECGSEMAVGATKSFIAQCYILHRMAGHNMRAEINVNEFELNTFMPLILKHKTIFFLGSKMNYAIAREGALKFKELALVYAEAFPTTEFKHGPLALTDSNSLAIIVGHGHKENIASEQITARGGAVLYIDAENPWNAIYSVQYLAIKTALARGINPDFPRNLAKSITVE